ncbi:MAG: hypothetical protein RLP44_14900 [Aggregatilineales bacterium]
MGDRIAFDLPLDYLEQTVDSLQINRSPVEIVNVGELAGIETAFTKEQLRKGTRVFRVKQ